MTSSGNQASGTQPAGVRAATRLGPFTLSQSALDNAPIGKLISSGDAIVWANAAADILLGTPGAELTGTLLSDHVHPADRAAFDGDTGLLLGGDDPPAREVRWRSKDGSLRWVAVHTSIALDATGEPLHLPGDDRTCVVRQLIDVTDRRAAEEDLARLHAVLEQRNRELERSNEELTQFAYIASHDLSEPLRVIAGHVELLEQRYGDELDDTAREWIGYAVDGCTRMRSLIDDLLEYSRAGRELRVERFEVAAVVDETTRRLDTALTESGATIETAQLPTLEADRSGLTQVLTNLVANAVKYAGPDAPPRIEISARREPECWVLVVRDHGIGIAPHQRDRVFRIFQRLHGREIAGTGIGLAICRKVLDQHGGTIRVVDTVGPGATFELALPDGGVHRS